MTCSIFRAPMNGDQDRRGIGEEGIRPVKQTGLMQWGSLKVTTGPHRALGTTLPRGQSPVLVAQTGRLSAL